MTMIFSKSTSGGRDVTALLLDSIQHNEHRGYQLAVGETQRIFLAAEITSTEQRQILLQLLTVCGDDEAAESFVEFGRATGRAG